MLVISKTPFRVSFFGGGTDYPVWYRENAGAVLGTSIDKYCYISCRYLPPLFDYKHQVIYSKTERVRDISEIKHNSIRETLKFMGITDGIEIHHNRDIPARTGLGASSTFTVGLLNALYSLKGITITKEQLVLQAIHIEQDIIKENVGSQDQTHAAFGGFNRIDFSGNHKIQVTPVIMQSGRLKQLQDHLLLIFTGFVRDSDASKIVARQIKVTPQRKRELRMMYEMVDEAVKILGSSCDLSEFGRLLHEGWRLKRSLTDYISTPKIDSIYEAARKAGAIGGKLLGAGGGGFLLLFVNPELQSKVKESLGSLIHVPFVFDNSGSQIIFKEDK